MQVRQSAEDYLETILVLQNEKDAVRSIDVAHAMGYSKASVSIAMKKLRESGHIEVDEEGLLHLSESGRAIALRVYDRHRLLTSFFMHLGISEATAAADACKIEHDLSEETFEKLLAFAKKITPQDNE